jgi:hypothetical protein
MNREIGDAVCPHRFLMVTDIDPIRSIETSTCYQCGTPLDRPFRMWPATWFPFRPEKLRLVPRLASLLRRAPTTVPSPPRAA